MNEITIHAVLRPPQKGLTLKQRLMCVGTSHLDAISQAAELCRAPWPKLTTVGYEVQQWTAHPPSSSTIQTPRTR